MTANTLINSQKPMTLDELNKQIAEIKIKELEFNNIQNSSQMDLNQSWWSTQSAMTISALVLVFGIVILVLAANLIKNGKASDAILRLFGTLVIVISAIFLVVAGYSDTQIAPVMGLLGTIAGYLLGKDAKISENQDAKPKEN